ncbi:MAG: cell division protein FtsA [Acidobacteria bacterium]|nr:cell division protein FtsA [Acidobacteriota bacterium]
MADRNTIVAVDLGSSEIKALVCGFDDDTGKPTVRGYHKGESLYIDKNGRITDVNSLALSLTTVIQEACNIAGVSSSCVVCGLPVTDINQYHSTGPISIPHERGAPGQVTREHIHQAIETAQNIRYPGDHEIIDILVEDYIIDNAKRVQNPLDMPANRLDVNLLICSAPSSSVMVTRKCIEKAGFFCEDIFLNPIAAGTVAVSRYAREKGCVHIDMGASLTTFSVYQNGSVIYMGSIPAGGKFVTSDLLVAYMVPSSYNTLNAVDMLKKRYNKLKIDRADEEIVLQGASGRAEAALTREQFVTVMVDRLYEIFDEVACDIEKNSLLDEVDEVVLSGGTARFAGITELCRRRFGKPVSVATPWISGDDMMAEINVPEFVTAYGLANYYYLGDERSKVFRSYENGGGRIRGMIREIFGKFKRG